MIYRHMYVGYPQGELKLLPSDVYHNVSLFKFREMAFLYFESDAKEACPETLCSENLKPFPDGSLWFAMPDIFHYAAPQSDEHWERKNKDYKPTLKINRLHHDKISSYIFYHFQLQEERPRPTKIKYSSIYIFGNYIVMYFEKPDEIDELDYPGILNTQNSPNSIWAQLMDEHFLGWEDYPEPWRPMELIASENPF